MLIAHYARFALCSCEQWGAEDGQFILRNFYIAILELFGDVWVIETLAWWNECLIIYLSIRIPAVSEQGLNRHDWIVPRNVTSSMK